jgi:cytochrome c-type protein NapB
MMRSSMVRALTPIILCAVAGGPALAKDEPTAERRAQSRISAYAPPTVPHDLFPMACLDCHGSNDLGAPMMPHREITNCSQCHVPQNDVPPFRNSTFRGVPEPKPEPKVAYEGGPPVIAHRVFMRENCLACHAQGARKDVKDTPHPERLDCRQCHVPQRGDIPLFRFNLNVADTKPVWRKSRDPRPAK